MRLPKAQCDQTTSHPVPLHVLLLTVKVTLSLPLSAQPSSTTKTLSNEPQMTISPF